MPPKVGQRATKEGLPNTPTQPPQKPESGGTPVKQMSPRGKDV
jgi:hypothetical protein